MRYYVAVFTKEEGMYHLPNVSTGWEDHGWYFETSGAMELEDAQALMEEMGLTFEEIDEDGWYQYHTALDPIHGDCASVYPESDYE